MRARVASDHRLTSTTDGRIAWLVGEAARLRREYGVPTGFQQAPYFQIQTERFALLAVDTGVLRGVDPDQLAWLARGSSSRAASSRWSSSAIRSTPEGSTRPATTTAFVAIHRLLREHGVALVMAGDTHDLEHYVERYRGTAASA